VHRDIKPSNILITTFGTPVLADFGISASLQRRSGGEVFAMSIPWSAPEVVAEQTSGTVASEVWSLGATVYSLLAGHSPFERRERGQNTKDLLRRRIARATYVEIPRTDVPAELQLALATAMSRDPARRHESARAFGEALREVQSGLGLSPTPLEIPDDEWSPASAPVDFADSGLRGPARSHIDRDLTRKVRAGTGVAALARDEDTEISAPSRRHRSALPWVIGIGAGLVVGAGAVLATLLAVGAL
jgi:serine/threonine protein kinase